jgi:hypothetical protein
VTLTFDAKHLAGQPRPTGYVRFNVGAKLLCGSAELAKQGSNSRAVCKTTASRIGRGKHRIVATYSGDAAYRAGSAKASFTLNKS